MRFPLRLGAALVAAAFVVAPVSAVAQASGGPAASPDPKGPPPRLANGKPSFSGIWATTRRADIMRSLDDHPSGHVPVPTDGRALIRSCRPPGTASRSGGGTAIRSSSKPAT